MANSRDNSVIYVDTTDTDLSEQLRIAGIKYIGNTSGTATITSGTGGSGAPLWEGNGATDAFEDVNINAREGINVALTNGAAVYIYLKL